MVYTVALINAGLKVPDETCIDIKAFYIHSIGHMNGIE